MENLKKKIPEEIDKAVAEGKVGLIATELERRLGEKERRIRDAANELKGERVLIESKFGKTRVYSPKKMLDLYLEHLKRGKKG